MNIPPGLTNLLQQLQASGFRDVAGARVSVTIPLHEQLLNALIASSMRPTSPVRELLIRPQASDRLTVRVRLARPAFLPPITVAMTIERQPELPASPEIVLRITSMPRLVPLAAAAMSFINVLPPGVRMAGDCVIVDLAAQLSRFGQEHLLPHLRRVNVSADEGRLILDVDAQIS